LLTPPFFLSFSASFKMVEVIRLNDQKFYKQRLFGFLTKFTSTSCTIKTLKLNGRYRATLTVFGEEESYIGEQSNRRAAEINACIRYINQNVVNQEMTWYVSISFFLIIQILNYYLNNF
jgi:hypothetical protein